MMYRLCLLGPTGRIAKVRRYWANTDEDAEAIAREMLRDYPTLIGFQLWTVGATSPTSGGGQVLVRPVVTECTPRVQLPHVPSWRSDRHPPP